MLPGKVSGRQERERGKENPKTGEERRMKQS